MQNTKVLSKGVEDLAFAVVLQGVRDYYDREHKERVEKWFSDESNLWLDLLDVNGKSFLTMLKKTPKDDVIAQIRTLSI